ncbi:hypothetical protein [Bdellovibrio bacteriovorus]|uniref:hypothetical protein n=1 Tax=Bdellovibrio bacteriovorus TaxID=959 RepID=UPI0035A6EFD0
MKTKVCFLFFLASLALTAGCGEEPTAAAVLPSTDEVTNDGVIEGTPLYLKLGVSWEGSDGQTTERMGNCSISPNAPIPTTINCSIAVPELQLYYSKVHFLIGTLKPEACSAIDFVPYYYRRSNQANFKPAGSDADIDCSASPADKKCYGGAGPSMIEKFPADKGTYFLPYVTSSYDFVLESENSTRWYGGTHVNYLVANDVADPSVAIANGPKQRVGGNDPEDWMDYYISCKNLWGETMYQINLEIKDEDQEDLHTGPEDQFDDWD